MAFCDLSWQVCDCVVAPCGVGVLIVLLGLVIRLVIVAVFVVGCIIGRLVLV